MMTDYGFKTRDMTTAELKKRCDTLFADIAKAEAGYVSEYSGKSGTLHAHHINGKTTLALRYSFKNIIVLTAGEHKFIAHRADRAANFREWAMKKKGCSEQDFQMMKKNLTTDVKMLYIALCERREKLRKTGAWK